MARDRRRIIYDNDATVITESIGNEENNSTTDSLHRSAKRSAFIENVTMSVSDVVDTFASYASVPRWFIDYKAEKLGECNICHRDTAYRFRRICVDCMDKYGDTIFDLARNASDNGETTITFEK